MLYRGCQLAVAEQPRIWIFATKAKKRKKEIVGPTCDVATVCDTKPLTRMYDMMANVSPTVSTIAQPSDVVAVVV